MKKTFRLLAIILVAIMLMPFTTVNANSTKTEEVLEKLNSSESFKDINGVAKYEDDTLQISYCISNSNKTYTSLPYEDNVIEYGVDELTNYYDAEDALSHYMFATKLMYSALKLNGYTEKQIQDFFQSEDSTLNYEKNGIEIKELGGAKEFESDDGASKLTVAPMLFKIDVAKANLNTSSNDEIELTKTTVEDVVADLMSDSDFINYKDENGIIWFENEITCEDSYIELVYTYYNYDYHEISFNCENDILTYEADEITSYEEATDVSEHEMWAMIIMQYALNVNGYTNEECAEFIQSEDNNFYYELNGIEIKELAEAKEFESDDGTSKLNVTPVSIKIDFTKANIEKPSVEYEFLEGADQTFDKTKNNRLKFRFSIDYDTFVKEGKIFIDSEEISKDNYVLSKGSTIVTFNDDYTNKLSIGKHTILASVENGKVETDFTIAKTESETKPENTTNAENTNKNTKTETTLLNPKTGDEILIYITLFTISLVGFAILGEKLRKPIK